MKCIYGQRPTQFRRPPTTTTTTWTIMTMMTSEHKYYRQSNRQSTNQAPLSFGHSASKKLQLAAQALMATLDENIRRDAMLMGSYRLRCNQHLYDTEAAQATRNITSGGTHHYSRHERRSDAIYKGHRKTWITVQYLDSLSPVYKSDMLVMPMRAYDLVRGLPWFYKQILDIDWARLTPCDP